jgi:dolichyl-phosphate-mannose-protein mannosyltransferase
MTVSPMSHESLEPAAPVPTGPATAGHYLFEPSIRTEWHAALILVLWFVAVAMALGIRRDIPVIDDWTYAWSVERLFADGRFEVLDWSAVYPLGHSLWGAAWSLVFGFSFATLRVSTLALSLLATFALYLILRELDARPRVALLGVMTVAANPAVMLLSSSFMTDVPFVAWTLLALLCYIRAIRRGQIHFVWWGGAWACAAFLDRQIAFVTPLAALPLLMARPRGEPKRSAVLLALGATWGAMLVCSLVMMSLVKPTGEMMKLVDRLQELSALPVTSYLTTNLYILCTIAFYALPALLAMATVRRLWRAPTLFLVTLFLAAIMLGLAGEIPVPLRPGNTWSLVEVGGSRGLVNGLRPPVNWAPIESVLRGAGLLAFGLALMSLRWPEGHSSRAQTAFASRPVFRRLLDAVSSISMTPRMPLVIYLIAYLVLANVLWMYNDRYLIVLLPVVVALALGGRQQGAEVPRLPWTAIAIFAAVAVIGTRDALRFNQSLRDNWQALVDSGVPPSEIDAGYVWNGWWLYAHPENLSGGQTVNDVPWITSQRRPTYILSTSVLTGYDVVREVTWAGDAPWPGPNRLLILKRQASLH